MTYINASIVLLVVTVVLSQGWLTQVRAWVQQKVSEGAASASASSSSSNSGGGGGGGGGNNALVQTFDVPLAGGGAVHVLANSPEAAIANAIAEGTRPAAGG